MAAITSFFQRVWICTGRISPPQNEKSLFIKLDRTRDLLKIVLQYLPGRDIASYLESHKVKIGSSIPKVWMALRHILMTQMEGEKGFATLVRMSQFQKVNPGKPFPCNSNIYNLDISNSDMTPKQLGDLLDRCPNVIDLAIRGCPNIKDVNFLAGR
ncbi:MAG TPA: hypothetical protein VLG44_03070, partial [Chlamydiales bacterium]|nr:hypothetical protein [Chlamydiales bacterium]